MLGNYFSLNGRILPVEQAKVSVDNIHFCYGYGVYETIKVRNNIIFFIDEHAERLIESAQIIGMETNYTKKEIKTYIEQLVDKIDEQSYNVKILLLGDDDRNNLYIFGLAPLYLTQKNYKQGVKTITTKCVRDFPKAKTLSMLKSYLAFKKAKENDCYDTLLIDDEGYVNEGTRSNLFFTNGQQIFTPPKDKVLDGVTKRTLIQAITEKGIEVQERKLKYYEIKKYKGFVLTNTSGKVIPITQIDDKKFEISDIIKKAIKIYNDFLDDYKKEKIAEKLRTQIKLKK